MDKSLYTIAELVAKDGKIDELKVILTDLAKETRKEPGAVEYFFILDSEKKNTILSYEKWENSEEEEKHWKTKHLKEAIEKMKDVLEVSPIVHKGNQII